MTQSNTSFPQCRKYLSSPMGVMAIEVPQNEEISGEERIKGEKKLVL